MGHSWHQLLFFEQDDVTRLTITYSNSHHGVGINIKFIEQYVQPVIRNSSRLSFIDSK